MAFQVVNKILHICIKVYVVRVPLLSIYLSGLVTAVAVFRNPNTIPFCLATDTITVTILKFILVFTDEFFRVYTRIQDCT